MPKRSRLLFYLGAALLLGLVIWFFSPVLVYVAVAAVVSLIGRPIVDYLGKIQIKNRRLPNALRAMLALMMIYGVAFLLFVLFIPPVLEETKQLEAIEIQSITEGLAEPIQWLESAFQKYELIGQDASIETYFRDKVFGVLGSAKISNIANSIVGFTGDLLIGIFSVTFIAFFFLKERGLLHNIIITLTPAQYVDQVNHILQTVKKLLSRYFIGVLTEVLLVGALISIGLVILGVENALIIGFFAGIFNIIPYLGPILGGLLGISLTILSSLELDFYADMVPLTLQVMVVFVVVQLIDNLVFQPYIYSSSVKAHPLEIFLIILAAGSFSGVGGMILAIPVYTIIRVVAKEFFHQLKVVQSITKSI
ncbi:MAG: AI-2E family transporter [Bacteroidota bacterium]